MADASLIEITAKARSKRGIIGWWRAKVRDLGPGRSMLMRLPSSPWLVIVSARSSDQVLVSFLVESAQAAKSIVSRLEGELADASTLASFLRMHSVPEHFIDHAVGS